jgi:hypothetical protein
MGKIKSLDVGDNQIENEKNEILKDNILWDKIKNFKNHNKYKNRIKYLLLKYGTKEPCNRFDVGNTIEFIIADLIKDVGFYVKELPNAKRIDLCINSNYNLSIKYSSVGDITLHNSNSCINKDNKLTDLLLLTSNKLYLITNIIKINFFIFIKVISEDRKSKIFLSHSTNESLKKNKICINDFIKNTGDSLKLKRNILTKLEKINYPYYMDFNININKNFCENKLCSKLFYKMFMIEYNLFK